MNVRYPFPDDLAEREAQHEDGPFAFDALAIATEYVAAEARVEPFWLAIIGVIGVVIAAIGIPLALTILT